MENYETNRQDLIKTGKFMMEYGLAWGNAGNISARVNEDTYLITASGTFLGELETEDLVECAVLGQSMVQEKKPSKETPMHQAIYQNRPEINAVLHASPFYSTLVACSNIDIPSNWFVETMYYLERVERVAYYHPGSQALGEAVAQKARKANVLLLENHGVLVYDTSLKEARMALQTLEMACKMLVTAQGAKIVMKGLPKEIEKGFLENAGYKPRRTW
ncbi:class II aldolase/adducin family protein [Mesobacillus sp. AQ2]|uniref:class II aldolase/adducin family protein n=1 Tax=Mesobacillus sp. AQ2 TaxID=3043332 RepID=UPI0024C1C636|nr:class II aldolase/adducin family protein [Mesobacillus sp. AQ2]WHX40337.1 class II aldolase/adducin family protein [Mesobacillus sp. AQ2]